MIYDTQGIQSEGRSGKNREEIGVIQEEYGKSKTRKNAKKNWYSGREKEFIRKYWMAKEINNHSRTLIYPDWSSIARTYMGNKDRDLKAMYLACRDKQLAYKKEYSKRPEVIEKTRERSKRRHRVRMQTEPAYRARRNLTKRFKRIMDSIGMGGSIRSSSISGCSIKELATHLERQFNKRMTWDNYGTYWQVDHILPCSSFDHNDPEQVKQCWHWTNLRPLPSKVNLLKSDKITEPQLNLMLSIH